MSLFRTITVAFACAALLTPGAISADPEPATEEGAVRVLYLEGLEIKEAIRLLRSEAGVRHMVTLRDRPVVVVGGSAADVDRAEAVLRDRGALERSVEPHEPAVAGAGANGETVTRALDVREGEADQVKVVLRAMYLIRDLDDADGGAIVTATGPETVITAAEALLSELDLLRGPGRENDAN